MSQCCFNQKYVLNKGIGLTRTRGKYFKVALVFIIKKLINWEVWKDESLHVFRYSQVSSLICTEEFVILLWGRRSRESLVLKLTHLLAKLFQNSVTNKTLSRLFKALPGGGETGFEGRGRRNRCSCAHFVVPQRIVSVRLQARCGIQWHYVTSSLGLYRK